MKFGLPTDNVTTSICACVVIASLTVLRAERIRLGLNLHLIGCGEKYIIYALPYMALLMNIFILFVLQREPMQSVRLSVRQN